MSTTDDEAQLGDGPSGQPPQVQPQEDAVVHGEWLPTDGEPPANWNGVRWHVMEGPLSDAALAQLDEENGTGLVRRLWACQRLWQDPRDEQWYVLMGELRVTQFPMLERWHRTHRQPATGSVLQLPPIEPYGLMRAGQAEPEPAPASEEEQEP